jgi:hypothetical protein
LALPEISDEAVRAAARRMPYKQRMGRDRPVGLPGDSEVEIVSQFSSDILTSEPSVDYLDDPNFYRDRTPVMPGPAPDIIFGSDAGGVEVLRMDERKIEPMTSSSSGEKINRILARDDSAKRRGLPKKVKGRIGGSSSAEELPIRPGADTVKLEPVVKKAKGKRKDSISSSVAEAPAFDPKDMFISDDSD